MTVFAVSIFSMAYAVVFALTPLEGEQGLAGTTFEELRNTNPGLATVLGHYLVATGTVFFGIFLLSALLAWKGLANGSALAWYSLTLIGVTILVAFLLAHVPIGHFSLRHVGPIVAIMAMYLIGVAISAKPILSRSAFQGPRGGNSPARGGSE